MKRDEIKKKLKDIFEVKKTKNYKESNLVSEHYGMSEEEFVRIAKRMSAALIVEDEHTSVLDQFFPELSGDQRVMVFAYGQAIKKYEIMNMMSGAIHEIGRIQKGEN